MNKPDTLLVCPPFDEDEHRYECARPPSRRTFLRKACATVTDTRGQRYKCNNSTPESVPLASNYLSLDPLNGYVRWNGCSSRLHLSLQSLKITTNSQKSRKKSTISQNDSPWVSPPSKKLLDRLFTPNKPTSVAPESVSQRPKFTTEPLMMVVEDASALKEPAAIVSARCP
jgi:hypothetical protein